MPFSTTGCAPSDTIGYLIERAWAMRARCACGHSRIWYAADLKRLPPGARLDDVGRRLQCEACGGDDGVVDVLNDGAEVSRRNLAAYKAGKGQE